MKRFQTWHTWKRFLVTTWILFPLFYGRLRKSITFEKNLENYGNRTFSTKSNRYDFFDA